MLTIKQRQTELKYLKYYDGKIDGIEGKKTKEAYKKLWNDYYFRKKDITDKYNKNTDILLQSVYNVKKYSKNFDIKKDKMYCRCKGKYCTGYPAIMNENLIKNLQKIRDKFGATTITSMLRCKKWNSKQPGSSNTSKHMSGKACDMQTPKSSTLKGRKEMIDYWFKLNKPNYGYCNGYYRSRWSKGAKVSKGMGASTHCDVR